MEGGGWAGADAAEQRLHEGRAAVLRTNTRGVRLARQLRTKGAAPGAPCAAAARARARVLGTWRARTRHAAGGASRGGTAGPAGGRATPSPSTP
jgi:hypothetical protein